MSIGISLFILSVFEWLHRPEQVNVKAFLYGGFGVFNIIPMSHLLINDFFFDNFGDTYSFSPSLPYYFMIGVSYLTGLYVYTVRYQITNLDVRKGSIPESLMFVVIVIKFGTFSSY